MKNVLLTGSATGFGLLTLKTLAAKGHTVYATMRNVNGANAAAAKHIQDWARGAGAKVEIVELDLTSRASINAAVKKILTLSNGRLDVLINNAGLNFIGISESLSDEQVSRLFEVNVLGPDNLIRTVLPTMRKQKDGLIINVSSVQARNHIPLLNIYNGCKAAIDAMSVGYHYELRQSGVDVIVVQPGGYPTTDFFVKQLQPANQEVVAEYGADMVKAQAWLDEFFTPKADSQNPQEVADKMLELIETKKGERPLWSLVGAGPLEGYFAQVNQTTKTIADTMMGLMTA